MERLEIIRELKNYLPEPVGGMDRLFNPATVVRDLESRSEEISLKILPREERVYELRGSLSMNSIFHLTLATSIAFISAVAAVALPILFPTLTSVSLASSLLIFALSSITAYLLKEKLELRLDLEEHIRMGIVKLNLELKQIDFAFAILTQEDFPSFLREIGYKELDDGTFLVNTTGLYKDRRDIKDLGSIARKFLEWKYAS